MRQKSIRVDARLYDAAITVAAADGSKANGEIRGIRKRVLAAAVFGAAVLAVL